MHGADVTKRFLEELTNLNLCISYCKGQGYDGAGAGAGAGHVSGLSAQILRLTPIGLVTDLSW